MKQKVISQLLDPTKFLSFCKNKYCTFVIIKLLKNIIQKDKLEIKNILESKITVTSSKEKDKLESFLRVLDCSLTSPPINV